MAELAFALVNSKSGLTYRIGQLEKSRLVRRRACPSDERAIFAVLSEQGMALLERAAPDHVITVEELLSDALAPDQVRALAFRLGEASRRMAAAPGSADPPGSTSPHAQAPTLILLTSRRGKGVRRLPTSALKGEGTGLVGDLVLPPRHTRQEASSASGNRKMPEARAGMRSTGRWRERWGPAFCDTGRCAVTAAGVWPTHGDTQGHAPHRRPGKRIRFC
ncbi:hypothetical protein [Streptomyces sp. NPDC002328]|uniref:hypothetical protein n=1 Tax=Streptomyces sp. NPDC002328 TaxID=3364642 RepID=UPI0036A6F44B